MFSDGTDRFLHVDLGTGLGGWTAPFRDSPSWRSVGLDIRDDLNADVVGDIRMLPFDCSPTLLTMSPPCTDFARWMLPWCDEPDPDLSLVEACLDAVDELDPDWWVLENSRGLSMYWRTADQNVGPYYLWGNLPPVDVTLTDGGKMSVSGENPEERAEIPYELADGIRRAVEGQRKLVTDGGTVEDGTEQLRRDEGCPIYLHNVGGKEPDGKPTRLGKWTFGTKMVCDVVLDHVDGRVLNACAGKTRLQKRGCEFVRNDIDEDRDADLHVDVREIHQHLESETFDAAILDPPFDPGRAAKLYEGWHGQEYASARDAVAELVAPGGTVVELGWNSWSLSDKDGWEPVEHHLFRQSSFKGDVHLTVDRRIDQKRLVPDGGGWNSHGLHTGTDHGGVADE